MVELFKFYKDDFGIRIPFDYYTTRRGEKMYSYFVDRDENGVWRNNSGGYETDFRSMDMTDISNVKGLGRLIQNVFE